MKEYFALQSRLRSRTFRDAGIHPVLAWPLVCIAFVVLSFFLFYKTQYAPYLYLWLGWMLILPLSEIRRYEFLRINFSRQDLLKIRCTENLLVTTPFSIFFFFQNLPLFGLIIILLALVSALFVIRPILSFVIPTPFSSAPFEFPIGFRNSYFVIAGIVVLLVISVSVQNFNLGIFCLLMMTAVLMGYYLKPEAEFYVWIYASTPRKFLLNKIQIALRHALLVLLPVSLVLCISFTSHMGLVLLFLLFCFACLVMMIVCKYVAYPDELGIIQGIALSLCVFLPPLILILIPYFFIKATKRLSHTLT